MPRQGVPYPSREICSLKCQIDALQRQINELMKSVNGVEGDGQGNVSLISGDPAIVINNDQAQHEIEISLDTSQLPAADVSSVNGQTGVVDLDGADIPLNPGQSTPTVQNAVAANAGNISQLQADLNQEIIDRGNADSALQSNINAVSAGIPAAAAAAVAADPTVAQLAVDVPNKLDKITSGSALKAYTHTGATQGEKSVVDGTTVDSIAIRDANGRLQAADPASGATDKTLVTSNWVSQTGDSAPNNLMHRSGNETVSGTKTFDGTIGNENAPTNRYKAIVGWTDSSTNWTKLYEYTTVSYNRGTFIWIYDVNNHDIALVLVNGYSTTMAAWRLLGNFDVSRLKLTRKDNNLILWVKTLASNNRIWSWVMQDFRSLDPAYTTAAFTRSTDTNHYTEPVVGPDYDAAINPSVVS